MDSPLDTVTWPLRTDRLTIRRLAIDDLPAIWAYRRQPAANEWMTREFPTEGAFRAHFEKPQSLATTLVLERDATVIGDLMLKVEDGWAQEEVAVQAVAVHAELGWCLDEAHTGRGYAVEAVTELIRCCFDDLGLRRVSANCFADNTPSWKLMEKVGMRREIHSVRDGLHRTRGWLDGYGYALLADEWRERA
ncbi:GNAT family N-acetyltransferase [Nakamurella lactea]|uniref:GNAT family N-acetyltransferase n=1 Tax=Nakamurella lactea TaxID=459515 RepID=UPI0003FF81E2|nr:GNAT family N-acetyltransferase [Nakamurella lactea]